jgi:hypothetical protein
MSVFGAEEVPCMPEVEITERYQNFHHGGADGSSASRSNTEGGTGVSSRHGQNYVCGQSVVPAGLRARVPVDRRRVFDGG